MMLSAAIVLTEEEGQGQERPGEGCTPGRALHPACTDHATRQQAIRRTLPDANALGIAAKEREMGFRQTAPFALLFSLSFH